MAADAAPIRVTCPACGAPIDLPARLCLDYDTQAQILVDLGASRAHARENGHQDVLPATLAHFGLPW